MRGATSPRPALGRGGLDPALRAPTSVRAGRAQRAPTDAGGPHADRPGTGSESAARPEHGTFDVALVVVHGMGNAFKSQILLEWAEPLLERMDWVARDRIIGADETHGVTIHDSDLSGDVPMVTATVRFQRRDPKAGCPGRDRRAQGRDPRGALVGVVRADDARPGLPVGRPLHVARDHAHARPLLDTMVVLSWLTLVHHLGAPRARSCSPGRQLPRRRRSGSWSARSPSWWSGCSWCSSAWCSRRSCRCSARCCSSRGSRTSRRACSTARRVDRRRRLVEGAPGAPRRCASSCATRSPGQGARRRRRRAPVRALAGRRGRDLRPLRGARAERVQRAPPHDRRRRVVLLGARSGRAARTRTRRSRPGSTRNRDRVAWSNHWAIWDPFSAGPITDTKVAARKRWQAAYFPVPETVALGPEEHAVHNTSQPWLDHGVYYANTVQVVEPTVRHLLGPDFPPVPQPVEYIRNRLGHRQEVARAEHDRRARDRGDPARPVGRLRVLRLARAGGRGRDRVGDRPRPRPRRVGGTAPSRSSSTSEHPPRLSTIGWIVASALVAALLIWLNQLMQKQTERSIVWDRCPLDVRTWLVLTAIPRGSTCSAPPWSSGSRSSTGGSRSPTPRGLVIAVLSRSSRLRHRRAAFSPRPRSSPSRRRSTASDRAPPAERMRLGIAIASDEYRRDSRRARDLAPEGAGRRGGRSTSTGGGRRVAQRSPPT